MDTPAAPSVTPKIVFSCANYGPLWAPAMESWLRCVAKTSRHFAVEYAGQMALEPGRVPGICGTGISDRTYTSSAENRLAEGFLANPDATHLFMTESDMIVPDDAILKLLAVEQDIVSGVYFLRESWGQPCLYRQVVKYRRRRKGADKDWTLYAHTPVTVFPLDKPFKLGDTQASGVPGFGCVLITRRVFERMQPPWFEIREGKCGSDMRFYYHAWDAGFDTWIHPEVVCGQIDYTLFTIQDYYDRLQEDPEFASSGYIIGLPPDV